MKRKEANAVAIRDASSPLAWRKLEQSAKAAIEAADVEAPALRLIAGADGITAQIEDRHGTKILIENGRVSVVASPMQEGE
jgi:hypothetical protein